MGKTQEDLQLRHLAKALTENAETRAVMMDYYRKIDVPGASSPIASTRTFEVVRFSMDPFVSSPVLQESGINISSLSAAGPPPQHMLTMAAPPPPKEKSSASPPPEREKSRKIIRKFSGKRTGDEGGLEIIRGDKKSSFGKVSRKNLREFKTGKKVSFKPGEAGRGEVKLRLDMTPGLSSPVISAVFPVTIARINLANISDDEQTEKNTFASSPIQDRKALEFKATTPSIISAGGRGWFLGRKQKDDTLEKNIVSISETEKVISEKAKSFGRKNTEFMGIYRGTGTDKLDQLVLPNVMGVESSRREVLDDLIDLKGPTRTMLALDHGGSLGVQIISSKYDNEKGFLEGRGKFISTQNLVLNKPLAQFMVERDRKELFP
ncbi:MAG: hypothetical protein KAI72_02480, partial [Candidatus Pacebacteria bacterium]|nr:hypothetical protein [Candidatus Paceibacterota bacterium]